MVINKMTEDQASFQKLLVGWWAEETEYLLQRIERWTLPRRYSKLHSPRISRGRLTMQENQNDESTWNGSSSKSNSPTSCQKNFTSLDEIRKINCCRTFYQSNSRFDSSCLEDYRYDHSIYFKTIGDIKNSKNKDEVNDSCQESLPKGINDCNCDIVFENIPDDDCKNVEDRPASTANYWSNYSHFNVDNNNNNSKMNNNNNNNNNNSENYETGKVCKIWPIVDIENLANYKQNRQEINGHDDNNNNNDDGDRQNQDEILQSVELSSAIKSQDRMDTMRFLSLRKTKRPKTPQQPVVCGDNNISWPRVLFSYNIDSTLAASHHRTLNVK